MEIWRRTVKIDPIPLLLAVEDPVLTHFTKQDLMGHDVGSLEAIWEGASVQKIVGRQRADGSWNYLGKKSDVYPPHHYALVETWKQFRFLVDQYGLKRQHPACALAAEFLFSCQSEEGDFRGMIGNQYATYYSGAIMGLLIKAQYEDDPRIEKGFQWLLSMRQDDGGWTIPILTVPLSGKEKNRLTSELSDPIQPDKTKPFSHNWTGMVLRAFAAHPTFRHSEAAVHGANLLASRFFKPDVYTSYKAADHWLRFQYPFWWNNLVSALDAVSLIGLPADDPNIGEAINWLLENQQADGLWKSSYSNLHRASRSEKDLSQRLWVSLAVCRILKRYIC